MSLLGSKPGPQSAVSRVCHAGSGKGWKTRSQAGHEVSGRRASAPYAVPRRGWVCPHSLAAQSLSHAWGSLGEPFSGLSDPSFLLYHSDPERLMCLWKNQDLKIQQTLGSCGCNTVLTNHDSRGPPMVNHLQFLPAGDTGCQLPRAEGAVLLTAVPLTQCLAHGTCSIKSW